MSIQRLRDEFNIRPFIHWVVLRSVYSGGWLIVKGVRLVVEAPFHAVDLIGEAVGLIAPKLQKSAQFCLKRINALFSMPEASIKRTLWVIDAMPWGGTSSTTALNLEASTLEPLEVVDISVACKANHVLIIAPSGTGKSTLAQYLSYLEDGEVIVYDPHHDPTRDWIGLTVIGGGRDYQAIAEAMETDLEDIDQRFKLRAKGQPIGKRIVTICDEYPAVAASDQAGEIAPRWLKVNGRESRKVWRKIILLVQDDNAATLGLDDGQGAARENFTKVRLGKAAVIHAKRLKDARILEWLRSQDYPAMVDDLPARLPELGQMNLVKAASRNLPSSENLVNLEPPIQSGLQPLETEFLPVNPEAEIQTWRAIQALFDAGKSESWVIKKVLGYEGGNFRKGQEILTSMRKRLGN